MRDPNRGLPDGRFLRISFSPGELPGAFAFSSGGEVCAIEWDAGGSGPTSALRVWRAAPPPGAAGIRVELKESTDGIHWASLPLGVDPEGGRGGWSVTTMPRDILSPGKNGEPPETPLDGANEV